MSATMEKWARQAARSALPMVPIEYGPWLGSMRSVSADQVPRDYATTGTNFLYLPRDKSFKRRGGQTIKFDVTPSSVGLLPAKWTGKGRWMEEWTSESITDGIPTVAALVTRENVATGTDDGRFSQFYLRDQVNSLNYTLGDEFNSTTYPAPGSEQYYKILPLWYDSGDGGLTRGNTEFARRFFVSGSRRFLKVGNWTYFPSLLGTPSRWRGREVPGALAGASFTAQASSDITPSGTQWALAGAFATTWQSIQTSDDTTSYIQAQGDNDRTFFCGLSATVPNTAAVYTISYRARRSGAAPNVASYFIFGMYTTSIHRKATAQILSSSLTTSFADYTATVTFDGTEGVTAGTANSLELGFAKGADWGGFVEITYLTITAGGVASSANSNRLIPSGPLPPLHSGTLAKGSTLSDTGVIRMSPITPDITVGAWVTAPLFSKIDETEPDTSDGISSPMSGAYCEVKLGNPSYTPTSSDTVTIKVQFNGAATDTSILRLDVRLIQGTALRANFVPQTNLINNGGFAGLRTATYTLTPAERNSIGTDWTDLRLRFLAFSGSAVNPTSGIIYWAAMDITQGIVQSQGGWKGSDRFYHSVAYRSEDGSVWMPCQARPPSQRLLNGFNLFTVDPTNPNTTYDRVTWSNIPIGPFGCIGRLLLRSPKISAVQDDNLQLDPFDMRVIWEIKDNTTTTYDDYYGSDESLTLDTFKAFIRFDHIMPPRARYIFGGDMRICHSYGGQNPCAIVLAPVGKAADYDLNLADTAAAAYANNASYMRVAIDTAGAGSLDLIKTDGTSIIGTTTTFLFTASTTVQQLVDNINNTSFANDNKQWRAQLCPGANPDATTLSLTPHSRAIASCVVSGQTITLSTGGLSKVAVGNLILRSGVLTSAYVSRIDSDTQLTFVGTVTAGTVTLTFYTELGDAPTVALKDSGYQRVIAGSLPSFLYFTKTYLNGTPLDKQAVWMTAASPGSLKSAANNFSGRLSNKFTPPANAGISMGGGGVDQGFVVPFANQIYVIRNVRDLGSGIDDDYRMVALNEARGCCAWNTVAPGNGFVPYLTPHGLFAADLTRELLLSEAIFLHAPATGDFTFEMPLCVAATAQDIDVSATDSTLTAYASARIMRGALWLNYRASGSHPNRQVVYDFSSGTAHSGLAALVREDGRTPWGWSMPLARSVTAMVEARRSDGGHLYAWNDENAGSTGDGRIDEIEVTDQDNLVDIVGSVETPWEHPSGSQQISGQDIILEHSAPAGSTGFLDFTRSYSADLYSLTPSTSSSLVVSRDVKMLPQAARVGSAACHLGYRQLTGGARSVRKMTLKAKLLPTFK